MVGACGREEKLSIWALFLFLVWSLREFFLVIFLTFIFSYIMTSVVRSAIRIFAPKHDGQWLHRILVTVSFLLLLGSLYGLVIFLKEPFKEQINRMALRIRSLDVQPQTIWDDLARETIGKWRYNELYKDAAGREREEEDLDAFREDKYQSTELERFRSLKENVTTLLRKEVVDKRGEAAFKRLQASNSVPRFDSCTMRSASRSHSMCAGSYAVSPDQPSVLAPSEIFRPSVGTG